MANNTHTWWHDITPLISGLLLVMYVKVKHGVHPVCFTVDDVVINSCECECKKNWNNKKCVNQSVHLARIPAGLRLTVSWGTTQRPRGIASAPSGSTPATARPTDAWGEAGQTTGSYRLEHALFFLFFDRWLHIHRQPLATNNGIKTICINLHT